MFGKKFRLIDIARQIDRDKSTIIRWEDMGLIPQAERDSRGWRFYNESDAQKIVELVKETNYFKESARKNGNGNGSALKSQSQGMVYIDVAIGIMVILSPFLY